MRLSVLGPDRHDALAAFRDIVTATVRGEAPDLSARQMAILLSVGLASEPRTVRGLAAELAVSKPAITRALDTLGRHGLVRRRRDALDRRNVLVDITDRGGEFIVALSGLILDKAAGGERWMLRSTAA